VECATGLLATCLPNVDVLGDCGGVGTPTPMKNFTVREVFQSVQKGTLRLGPVALRVTKRAERSLWDAVAPVGRIDQTLSVDNSQFALAISG
jgi:hypothetical protein